MIKILSYNLNGIRAAFKKDFLTWLSSENPDIVCLQETKAQPDQIEVAGFEELGYKCFWFSAEKKGYSGVGILTKLEPKHVEYGMGIPKYDAEGRFMRADFEGFSVVSVYHPSGSRSDERQAFKMVWLADFRAYVNGLRAEFPNLVLSGDYNICRLWIDIHNPSKQQNTSGFLPEEREWFQNFVDDGWVDSFRQFEEGEHHYSWWTYRAGARAKNKGWRIDYNMLSAPLAGKARGASILPAAMHSDHCPVVVELDL